ncbi:lasso peptide biosynthesis B2 protein [Nostoc sp. C057]|uniref:lasso peptide biosynthesis B2 protein n=1 Tax=Nostoc sp. C057 TaxID=2576903 RepID=UPI0015C3B01B|nr:lasso peptide biosynthesis B2 protein [Nostoc sp. C057]QLE49069.1 lasso peptide biosynthesis B2 protein [Nostoc sp. C057]
MKYLSKFIKLNSQKKQLLINTFIVLTLVRLGLWLLSFKTLHQLLLRLSNAKLKYQEKHHISIETIIWAVEVSSHYMLGVKCLARALTCQVFMSRHGYTSNLCIGVAKGQEGELKAHAWLENQGQVVIGDVADLPNFSQLASFAKEHL